MIYDGTPEIMAEYACLAREAGARLIGGCCGTMPMHLVAMREALESRPRGARPEFDAIRESIGDFSSESDGTEVVELAARRPRRGRRRA